jgi:uncharacterized membrane protein
MTGVEVNEKVTLGLRSLKGWLAQGWSLFRQNSIASMGFVLPFVLVGMLADFWLGEIGLWLIYFILAAGFILLLPVLLAAYYRVPQLADRDIRPGYRDIVGAFFSHPGPVWVLGIISGALFLIWVTDAVIVYSMYFEFEPIREVFSERVLEEGGARFFVITGLLGFVISAIVYLVTVVAIPHMVCSGAGLVDGIVFSAKGVAGSLPVMVVWAMLLGTTILLVLLFALPLALVLLPLLSYANYACYQEMSGGGKR